MSQQKADKQRIDKGIAAAKKAITEGNLDQATKEIAAIQPPSTRLQYRVYELTIFKASIAQKKNDIPALLELGQQAVKLNPAEPTSWRPLLTAQGMLDSPVLSGTFKSALNQAKTTSPFLQFLAKFLPKVKDQETVLSYLDKIQQVPDWEKLSELEPYIPDLPQTLEIRMTFLKAAASTNRKACAKLVHIFYDEFDPRDAVPFLQYLPQNHKDVAFIKTIVSEEPTKVLEAARAHIALGKPLFKTFISAVEKNDVRNVRNAVNLIPKFLGGFRYLLSMVSPDEHALRVSILTEATKKCPFYDHFHEELSDALANNGDLNGALKILENIQEHFPNVGIEKKFHLLVALGRPQEAEKYLAGNSSLTQIDDATSARINILMFRETKDKERGNAILQLPDTPEFAFLKAEVAWEMRNELGENAKNYFIAAMKADKENPIGYVYFSRWQKDQGDEAKAQFLMETALKYGASKLAIFSPEEGDTLCRVRIGENKLEEALELCRDCRSAEWSHFRAGLILQRLGRHSEACDEFNIDRRAHPERLQTLEALAQSFLFLGRLTSARNAVQQLRDLGKPNDDLESQISLLWGVTILEPPPEDWSTPVFPQVYVQQAVRDMKMLRSMGRARASLEIAKQATPTAERLHRSFPSLAAVLKTCGDFQMEVYESLNFFLSEHPSKTDNLPQNPSRNPLQNSSQNSSQNSQNPDHLQNSDDGSEKSQNPDHLQNSDGSATQGLLVSTGRMFRSAGVEVHEGDDIAAAKKAIAAYKMRCEKDRRAESFIDLARAMSAAKMYDAAQTIVMRALDKFPHSSPLWAAVGVGFTLSEKYAYARHCFSVAAMLSASDTAAPAYSLCAAIAHQLGDAGLEESALEVARLRDPDCPEVWLLLSQLAKTPQNALETALMAYNLGGDISDLPNLPSLFLAVSRNSEALGFSQLTNDLMSAAVSFEGDGNLEAALQTLGSILNSEKAKITKAGGNSEENAQNAQNSNVISEIEEVISRIEKVKQGKAKFDDIRVAMSGKSEEEVEKEAKRMLAEVKGPCGALGAATLLLQCGKEKCLQQGLICLYNVIKRSPKLALTVSRMLRLTMVQRAKSIPRDMQIETNFDDSDYLCFFLAQIYSKPNLKKVDAAINTAIKFPKEGKAQKLALSCLLASSNISHQNDLKGQRLQQLLEIAAKYYQACPGRDALLFLAMADFKSGNCNLLKKHLQSLCVLSPELILKMRPILAQISQFAQPSNVVNQNVQ